MSNQTRSNVVKTCKHCGDEYKGYEVPNWLSEAFCSYECRNIHMAGLTHVPAEKTNRSGGRQ